MSTTSANRGYTVPTVGSDVNEWGYYLDTTLNLIDSNLSALTAVNVGGSSNVVASSTQYGNLVQQLIGTLTGNIEYQLPAAGGFWVIDNQTSGSYTVTVCTTAGGSSGVIVAQGSQALVYSDGTNIKLTTASALYSFISSANGGVVQAGGIELISGTSTGAVVTGSISGTVMTVTSVTSGNIIKGASVSGSGVASGTVIISHGTGTGGVGTYNLNVSSSVTSETLTTSNNNRYLGMGSFDIGDIKDSAATTTPSGWLVCNGAAISRTTYALLYAAIGTTYGSGDGSTTFNIPDCRGRSRIGYDSGGSAGRVTTAGSGVDSTTLGATGGSQFLATHTHSITDPGHTHTVSDSGHVHSITDPGHAHSVYDPTHTHGVSDPGHTHSIYDAGHQHNISAYGGYGAATGGYATWAGNGYTYTTQTAGTGISNYSNTTGISNNYAGTSVSIYTGYTGVYNNIAYTGISNVSNTTGITAQNAGSGSSANMPPTIVFNTLIYAGV